jgi:hypothetical protein
MTNNHNVTNANAIYLYKICLLLLPNIFFNDAKTQERTIFLRIDTIELHSENDITNYKKCGLLFGMEYDYMDRHYHLSFSRSPAYANEIVVYGENTKLFLPIDCNNGYVSISNIYKLSSDTLRIKKLELFHTQTLDTIYNTIATYRQKNGELQSPPIRVKRRNIITKPISPPNPLVLLINEQEYKVESYLKYDGALDISDGHKRKPNNYLDKNGNYKKRIKYIHISSNRISTYWFGEIRL